MPSLKTPPAGCPGCSRNHLDGSIGVTAIFYRIDAERERMKKERWVQGSKCMSLNLLYNLLPVSRELSNKPSWVILTPFALTQ